MTNDPTSTDHQKTGSVGLNPDVPIPFCDGVGLKRLVRYGLAWLERHQASINSLNVYPVPDGDTGTNMVLTMRSAFQEIHDSPEENVGIIAQKVAHGALMGARGNSGVILSQILRGFARSLKDVEAFDTIQFAAALREAAATAYKGVIKPVEGTILTVARESAEAGVAAATASRDLRYVLEIVVQEARESVTRTPTLLPVLAEAGVVDAGGQGLLVILDGMLRYTRGEQIPTEGEFAAEVDLHAVHPDGEEGYGYDIQFLIHGKGLAVETIRETIASMGDCALIVGDSYTVKVHVHSPDPGPPISYGARVGSLSQVIVENMQEQYQEYVLSKAEVPAPAPSEEPLGGIGTVVVAPGPGLQQVFESLGASAVVSGGQTMNPSTEDLLSAAQDIRADEVIILPNNKNILMAAEAAGSLCGKEVEVVPTVTIPQGITALLSLNYQADLASNVRVMTEAAKSIETAEITTAVRSAQISGLEVQDGEVVGLVNGNLCAKGDSRSEVTKSALAEIGAEDFEIVTIYYGDSISPDEAQQLADEIQTLYPEQEIEIVDGGQPHYHYILSAE